MNCFSVSLTHDLTQNFCHIIFGYEYAVWSCLALTQTWWHPSFFGWRQQPPCPIARGTKSNIDWRLWAEKEMERLYGGEIRGNIRLRYFKNGRRERARELEQTSFQRRRRPLLPPICSLSSLIRENLCHGRHFSAGETNSSNNFSSQRTPEYLRYN